MKEFNDFAQWVNVFVKDRHEEYYRGIFELHYAIASLLQAQKFLSFDYTIDSQDGLEGKEYHFVDQYYKSKLIIKGKLGLRELDRKFFFH